MATRETFHIGKRSITSGGKTHKPNKAVTHKIMDLTEEQFAHEVKRGAVLKGTPPDAKTPAAPPVVLRAARIHAAIGDMYKPDGSHKSDDDFTNDGKPSCPALNIAALLEGEDEITGAERDAAWEKYQADKAAE